MGRASSWLEEAHAPDVHVVIAVLRSRLHGVKSPDRAAPVGTAAPPHPRIIHAVTAPMRAKDALSPAAHGGGAGVVRARPSSRAARRDRRGRRGNAHGSHEEHRHAGAVREGMTFAGTSSTLARPRISRVRPAGGWGRSGETSAGCSASGTGASGSATRRSAPCGGSRRSRAAPPNTVISEEWSSDCRRDVPMLAHLAEAGGLELRIFTRDGQKLWPRPAGEPGKFAECRHRERVPPGARRPDVPVGAGGGLLHEGTPVPLPLHRVPGDLSQDAAGRGDAGAAAGRDYGAAVGELYPRLARAPDDQPLFPLWASATIDEMLSALHERDGGGSLA